MKTFAIFYLKQVLILGTVGFTIFQCVAWWQIGWFWASDTLEAWLLAIALVGIYLTLVGMPVLWGAHQIKLSKWSIVLVSLSGPAAVLLWLSLFSNRETSFYNYVIWPWHMHLIFSVIGLWFGLSYEKFKKA